MRIKYKTLNNKFNAGYTFMELIIVIAIFSIISSVVLFNSGNFSSSISLQNTTADIALQIKEAQSDAIAGRLTDNLNQAIILNGDEYYKPVYGVRFETGNNEFTRYADLPGYTNWVFDAGTVAGVCNDSVPECLRKVKINGFDSISEIRVREVNASSTDYIEVDVVDVSFQRPFPDAIITADGDNSVNYNDVEIILTSVKSGSRKIIINSVGSISIEQVNP